MPMCYILINTFYRKGCNLNCSYCDTAWANTTECTFEEMLPTEIYNYIKDTRVKNITLTGGEPLLQSDMGELLEILNNDGEIRVEVETNGAVSLRPFCNVTRPYFTMDYEVLVCDTIQNSKNLVTKRSIQ